MLFYQVIKNFDYSGLIALKFIFCSATIAVILNAQRLLLISHSSKRSTAIYGLLLFQLIDLSNIWIYSLRAQIFTYLGLALFILAFIKYRYYQKKLALYLLPAVTIIWSNSHGGFVVGLGFLLIFTITIVYEQGFRLGIHPCLSFLLCGMATLINPYGFSYLIFIFQAVTNPPIIIIEWVPTTWKCPQFWLMIFILTLTLKSLFNKSKIIPFESIIFIVLAAYAAFSHIRFTPMFSLVSACYAPIYWPQFTEVIRRKYPNYYSFLSRGILIFILLVLGFSFLRLTQIILRPEIVSENLEPYPVQALEWLYHNRDGGKVLLDYNEGSYALWRLYPKFTISLDGRYDGVFYPEMISKLMAALDPTAINQQEVYKALNPDYILLQNQLYSITTIESMFPDMYCLFRDNKYSIYGKVPNNPSVIASNSQSIRPLWQSSF